MNRLAMLALAGSTAFALPAFAQAPAAPAPAAPPAAAAAPAAAPGIYCGGPAAANTLVPANDVSQCEVHKVIADAANSMQYLRNRQLLFGIQPRNVMVGIGTVVDIENPAAPTLQNARWEYAPDFRLNAARWDIRPGGKITDYATANTADRIIHVVKGDKAWDEKGAPGLNPTDVTAANLVTLRRTMLFVSPHAIIRAAGFTSKGLCPTGGTVAAPAKCPDNKVSVEGNKTINLTLYGVNYKVTLDAQNRPGTIETTVNGMPLVATYTGWRDGKGMSGGKNPGAELVGTNRGDTLDELAFATDVLDKYRYGTYYPGRIVETLGGKTVLDVTIMAGYTNKYVVFPDPAVVRAAGPVPK
jgi:hypothetical protein